MRIVLTIIAAILCLVPRVEGETIVPPDPVSKYTNPAQKADIIVLVDIDLSADPPKSTVGEVLYGEKAYQKYKDQILKRIPKHEKRAGNVLPPMEIFYAKLSDDPFGVRMITSIALYKTRAEVIGGKKFVFKEHSLRDIKAAIAKSAKKAKQDGRVERKKAAQFSSYLEDQRFDFDVYEEDLSRTPSWEKMDEFPPLSPRKAEAIARIQLDNLVKESGKWTRDGITLIQVGRSEKWIYSIRFTGFLPPGVIDGIVPDMTIIVLMDARAIKPAISPFKMKRISK